MNHKNDILFWIEAILVAVLGCLILKSIDLWFKPSEPLQVKNYEYPTTLTWDDALYGPTEAFKRDWCRSNRACRVMAKTLVYEARGEPIVGAYAVAYVIMERVHAKRWPDTIEGVVNYRCHFSWRCEHPQKNVLQKDWDRAYLVSYDVLHNEVENPAPGADHYLNPDKVKRMPKWTKEYEYVVDIGNHKFYRSEQRSN